MNVSNVGSSSLSYLSRATMNNEAQRAQRNLHAMI